MSKKQNAKQFAVLGLGRFGMSIVKTLSDYDVEILACDKDAARLHEATDYVTQAIQVDVSDEEALRRLGIGNFDVVVLTMGEDFEGSVLAAMTAKELGAGYIVAKAIGVRQKKILESVGVDQVVLPEMEMGAKIAHSLVKPNLMDALGEFGAHGLAEMRPLDEWIGKTVGQSDIRRRHGYTLLAVVRGDETLFPVQADLALEKNDILLVLSESQTP